MGFHSPQGEMNVDLWCVLVPPHLNVGNVRCERMGMVFTVLVHTRMHPSISRQSQSNTTQCETTNHKFGLKEIKA